MDDRTGLLSVYCREPEYEFLLFESGPLNDPYVVDDGTRVYNELLCYVV